jgi:putative hydrolase of the HAD superfamily
MALDQCLVDAAIAQALARASHQLRMRKPERRAFDRVCAMTSFAPRDIVFFDDLRENVDAAVGAGLCGVHVRSPDDVSDALDALGLCVAGGDARG